MVTVVPGGPLAGVKEVITGCANRHCLHKRAVIIITTVLALRFSNLIAGYSFFINKAGFDLKIQY